MERYYIKVVVEGKEEYTFFDIVRQIGTNNCFYMDIEDASGYGNIADAFLSALREDIYDCVICVYDVDNRANDKHSPFNITRFHLMSIFQNESAADAVSYCTNPNIIQLFLLAADTLENVSLKYTSKNANTDIIHKYWPDIASGKKDESGRKIKNNYDASSWQLDLIKYSIINGEYSYDTMLENIKELSIDYKKDTTSSNLFPLLLALKNGDVEYFKRIKTLIDSIDD